ncbi:MAG: hypothetical protein Q8P67_01930, partial [archaeon]|nr:hypothetical protein [archaeon]
MRILNDFLGCPRRIGGYQVASLWKHAVVRPLHRHQRLNQFRALMSRCRLSIGRQFRQQLFNLGRQSRQAIPEKNTFCCDQWSSNIHQEKGRRRRRTELPLLFFGLFFGQKMGIEYINIGQK